MQNITLPRPETKQRSTVPSTTGLEPLQRVQYAPIVPSVLVQPVTDTETIIQAWKQYQELKTRLLDTNDYQIITGKKFIKKSGWRKIQTAFGISDEVIKEERKEHKGYFVYEVTVKVTANNGRYATALGSCASNERKFAHPEHDIRSTAHTRAKNRAISDLVGGGEVSAEEVVHVPQNANMAVIEEDIPVPSKDEVPLAMTQSQRWLLIELIDKKAKDYEQRLVWKQKLETLNRKTASDTIRFLKGVG